MRRYNPREIEPKWQQIWEETKLYSANLDSAKPKYIGFGMFNYPSGEGIHVGHVRNYTIPDVITRYKRQKGFEAYQPVGWDSFGLPAENFAIKTGVSPQESTKKAIEKYRQQYRAMGWAVDWTKEINTTDPDYYRWTQWTFLKLFENDLAYQKESPQWWCPHDQTVLADEQVEGGRCWRCGHIVEKRNLKQWFFKITDYADEILAATDDLNWTEAVKASQKAWIGRSPGALIKFEVKNSKEKTEVFTTRPDTIFGATYMVLAPEHPLVDQLTTDEFRNQVHDYAKEAGRKSDLERQEGGKHKTGVPTGAFAINPATKEEIPIWIADYVLMGYGTGAIMAVPAHDERDFEFATKFGLEIKQVIAQVLTGVGENQFRPGEKIIERTVAQSIVWHPTEKKLIVLEVPAHKWKTLVMGGIDNGEDWIEGAKREIHEETGYKNAEFVGFAGQELWSEFWALHKNENRIAHFRGLEFKLKDLDHDQIDESETGKHKIHWMTPEEALQKLTISEPIYFLNSILKPDEFKPYTGEGKLINSGIYDGMESASAREKIVADLTEAGIAKEQVNYKIRDWLISRQRYWGAPIPIIHCPDCGTVPVPEDQLPVLLPEVKNYEPTGGNVSVLAGVEEWVNVKCPKCGGNAKRETDTMDGYVCSSWYFMRYLSPDDKKQAWSPKRTETWMPIDFYNGADHATAHLLYARFYTRFFHKLGLVGTPEPFAKMVYNGKVKAADGSAFSKSKGNGVDPLEIIESGYGADALRLYELFAAPVELDVLWDPQGVPGTYRFLNRVWILVQEYLQASNKNPDADSLEVLRAAQKIAKKVTKQIEDEHFNTAIASLMELSNELYRIKSERGIGQTKDWHQALETFVQLLAPLAPHMSEELWSQLDHTESVHISGWPVWDENLIKEAMITLVVQINGKVRSEIIVDADISEQEAIEAAKTDEKTASYLKDKTVKKAIFVPGRLVSLVVD